MPLGEVLAAVRAAHAAYHGLIQPVATQPPGSSGASGGAAAAAAAAPAGGGGPSSGSSACSGSGAAGGGGRCFEGLEEPPVLVMNAVLDRGEVLTSTGGGGGRSLFRLLVMRIPCSQGQQRDWGARAPV
jgi:hypothetical protein